VILGFEHATYSISEGNGSVEVCVQVKSGVLRSSLSLSLDTVDGNATGEQWYMLLIYHESQCCMAYSVPNLMGTASRVRSYISHMTCDCNLYVLYVLRVECMYMHSRC